MQPLRPYEKHDTLKQFLDHDRHVLRFFCTWDDSQAMFGDVRQMILHYFLADDTIEIREVCTLSWIYNNYNDMKKISGHFKDPKLNENLQYIFENSSTKYFQSCIWALIYLNCMRPQTLYLIRKAWKLDLLVAYFFFLFLLFYMIWHWFLQIIPPNSGRDATPMFLHRNRLPKGVESLKQPGVSTDRTVLNVFGPTGQGGRYILDSLKVYKSNFQLKLAF